MMEPSLANWRELIRQIASARSVQSARELTNRAERQLASWPDELRLASMDDELTTSLWTAPDLPPWAELIRSLQVAPQFITETRCQPHDMSSFRNVTTLIVGGRWHPESIVRAIEQLPSVHRLLWMRPSPRATMAAVMAHSSVAAKITGLSFRKCSLGSRAFDSIVQGWAVTALQELDICENRLKDAALDLLRERLAFDELAVLDLSNNSFSSEALERLLRCLCLRDLYLSGLSLGDVALARALTGLNTTKLRKLVLDDTGAGPNSMRALQRLDLSELTMLSAKRGNLDDSSATAIIEHSSLCRSATLHLEENYISKEGCLALEAEFTDAQCGVPYPEWIGY